MGEGGRILTRSNRDKGMKENRLTGSKKASNKWSSWGGSMKKHAISGVPHNHSNSIARTRDTNRRLAEEAQRQERIKARELKGSVKELFFDL